MDALLAEAGKMELKRLKGHSIRRSRFTEKMLSRDNPLGQAGKRKNVRAKYKTRADSLRKKRRQTLARYRAKALLSCESCYRHYRTQYRDRWKISPREWREIWDEAGLEGVSPVIARVPGSRELTPYSILIRSKQERKLRATLYDGQSRLVERLSAGGVIGYGL